MTATPNSNMDHSVFFTLLDKQVTNCYKHLLLASIVKFAERGGTDIDLKLCAAMMIQMTWKIVTEDGLCLGKQDSITSIIKDLRFLPFFESCSDGNAVYTFLTTQENKYFEDLIGKLNNYVPYRLLSPFYEDKLKGLNDAVKNAKILEFSNQDANALYYIRPGKLVLNKKWSDFINENRPDVCKYISDKFYVYLCKKNPDTVIKQSALLFE